MSGPRRKRATEATPHVGHERLRNQRLLENPLESPEHVVAWLGAVQAQDYHGAKWGLAQRTRHATSAAIDRLFNEGRILRTHVLRPTWHFVLPSDIRWLLALTSPRVHSANASSYRKLELDDALFARSQPVMAAELQGGRQCTRAELGVALARSGIAVSGQRLAYVLMHAELDAVICSGGLRGKQFTYALLEERVAATSLPDRETSLAELARRYFTSHGPATVHDFAWWSGLTMKDARAGADAVRPRLEQECSNRRTWWFPRRRPPSRTALRPVHLLPNYDEHIVAYKDHGPSLHPELPKERPADSLSAHLIVRDGLVIGGWRRALKKSHVEIRARLQISVDRRDDAALRAAAEDYGRFLGLSAIFAR